MAKQLTDAEIKELRALLKAVNKKSPTVTAFVNECDATRRLAQTTAEKVRKCGC